MTGQPVVHHQRKKQETVVSSGKTKIMPHKENLASERSKKSNDKKVRFASMARFKRVRPYYHFTQEEHDATWYSESELGAVVQDCIATCKMMLDGDLVLEEEGYCTRGLEAKIAASSPSSSFRKVNKSRAIRVVLQECKIQQTLGIHEPEYLAILYSKATRETQRLAHLMALRDQEVASQILAPIAPACLLGGPTRDKKASDHGSPDPISPVSDSESSVSCSIGRAFIA